MAIQQSLFDPTDAQDREIEEYHCAVCGKPFIRVIWDNKYCPYVLECYYCEVQIRADSFEECLELSKQYNQPNTSLDCINGNITYLKINNKVIIE